MRQTVRVPSSNHAPTSHLIVSSETGLTRGSLVTLKNAKFWKGGPSF
jgi:hypothetical protein